MKYLLLLVALCSCGPRETGALPPEISVPTTQTRFKLERMQGFHDGVAYNGERWVYILTDTETGRTWVGVNGIGIAELGSHWVQTGKVGHTEVDER